MKHPTRRQLLLATAGLALTAAGTGGLVLSGGWQAFARPARVPHVGYANLDLSANSIVIDAFRQGMRELGWVAGENFILDLREAGQPENMPAMMADLLAVPIDVILVSPSAHAFAAERLTRTIPIVMAGCADPVELGLVASLAHPGGNITGVARLSDQLGAKHLELLKELLPSAARIGVLTDSTSPAAVPYRRAMQTAATTVGFALHPLQIGNGDELQAVFDQTESSHDDALVVESSPLMSALKVRVIALAAQARLPAIYEVRQYVEAGGLLAYGENGADLHRRAAKFVDEILKGANPADLPVELPTSFELTVNVKALQALGLSIPDSLAPQVTEWIQ